MTMTHRERMLATLRGDRPIKFPGRRAWICGTLRQHACGTCRQNLPG